MGDAPGDGDVSDASHALGLAIMVSALCLFWLAVGIAVGAVLCP